MEFREEQFNVYSLGDSKSVHLYPYLLIKHSEIVFLKQYRNLTVPVETD